jgi:hypothetical protein
MLGGVVGSCASKGLGVEQRLNKDKQGGITNIIFVSAFILQIGESLLDKLGGQMPPWMKLEVNLGFFFPDPNQADVSRG